MKEFIKKHPKKVFAVATVGVAGAVGYFVPELREDAYRVVRAALTFLVGGFL